MTENNEIKEICEADNRNQRLYKNGLITRKEYEDRKETIHDQYIKKLGELEMLKKLMKKHGGNQ